MARWPSRAVARRKRDQPLRVANRQAAKHEGVDDGKGCGDRADADGQRQHRDAGEPGAARASRARVAQVLDEDPRRSGTRTCRDAFLQPVAFPASAVRACCASVAPAYQTARHSCRASGRSRISLRASTADVEPAGFVDRPARCVRFRALPSHVRTETCALSARPGCARKVAVVPELRSRAHMSQLLADLRYALRSLRRVPAFHDGRRAVDGVRDRREHGGLHAARPGDPAHAARSRARPNWCRSRAAGWRTSAAAWATAPSCRIRCTATCAIRTRSSPACSAGRRHRCTSATTGAPSRSPGELVSGTFFPMLGVRPALGRLFTPDDERTPAGIRSRCSGSCALASRASTAIPTIVGRTITVNGQPLQVVGVVQQGFEGLDIGQPAQVYVPVSMQPKMGPAWLQLEGRRFRWVQVYAPAARRA